MSDGKKPKFPLPRGYFGDVQLSKEQQQYYREFCANQVKRGLLDERAYLQSQRHIDLHKWKPVRSQHTFQLFRRRDGGLHENDGKPSMLGIGRVEGSIEDVIYGAYDQTDEELRMTAELVEVDFGDGIVLANIEQGSPADPYRYLGVKWILTPFPMPAIMPDRDWILLESMGISKDSSGRRYGYHTLFTIEMAQCPTFPQVIRGTMWYTFIYRDAGRGMIDVHSQGYFDCLGELMDPLTIIGSTQMFNGVFRYMKSSEAKKLTILALENLERKIASGDAPTSAHSDRHLPSNATCGVCTKSKSANPFSTRRLRVCRICDAFACSNCRVKKNILVGRQRVQSKVAVCHRCIAHAKTLIVQPSIEKYVISREMQLGDVFQTAASVQHHFGTLMARTPGEEATVNGLLSTRSRPGHSYPQYYHASSSGGDGYYDPYDPFETRTTRIESRGEVATEAAAAPATVNRSAPPPARVQLQTEPPAAPQRTPSVAKDKEQEETDALFKRMLDLQNSAKRAHELTEANRILMQNTTTRA